MNNYIKYRDMGMNFLCTDKIFNHNFAVAYWKVWFKIVIHVNKKNKQFLKKNSTFTYKLIFYKIDKLIIHNVYNNKLNYIKKLN